MSHYSEGRRYSYICNAWILESSWNDKEQAAFLDHRINIANGEIVHLLKLVELKNELMAKALEFDDAPQFMRDGIENAMAANLDDV